MKYNIKKSLFFCIIFFILFLNIQNVFQAKWPEEQYVYERVKSFYNDQRELDVVFIGSSHVNFTINPLLLFQEYGIVGRNFSSPTQDLSLNLLYIQEVIKSQKAKLIVLDVSGVKNWFLSEASHRKGVDAIPLTLNKLKQIEYVQYRKETYNHDTAYDSLLSYIFPLARYHDRWDELDSVDFNDDSLKKTTLFKGYTPFYNTVVADFSTYYSPMDISNELINEQKQLFEEIVLTCRENNIELLLIKSPSPLWKNVYYELVVEWANEYGISFIDYNNLMEEVNIDVSKDFSDATSHLNDSGATKITLHLGKYLDTHYNFKNHRGNEEFNDYELGWELYQSDKVAYFLSHEISFNEYVKYLNNPNYTIYFSVKDSIGGIQHPELAKNLVELGLTDELTKRDWWGYQAILKNGEVYYEKLEDAPLRYENNIDDRNVELISEGWKKGNRGSIKIDGKEYFVDHRGVGIVVYDNVLDKVVDSVTFDLWAGGKAYRN